MKNSIAILAAGLLLAVAGQRPVESLKSMGKTASLQQQEADFQQEELRAQQHIEQLRQQQHQAELQIAQHNEEAQRQLALQQQQQQQPAQFLGAPRTHHSWFGGLKSSQTGAYSRPALLTAQAHTFERQYPAPPSNNNNSPYVVPPHSTIAYLVVRPPAYPAALAPAPAPAFDELAAYRSYATFMRPAPQQPIIRQQTAELLSGTKGGEPQLQQQQQQQQLEEPIVQQQQEHLEQAPIVQQQAPQPALVVPLAKEGKLKALLDRIMSKFAHGTGGASYSVASEEMLYPQGAPQKPLLGGQQQIEQQQQQQQQEELPQQQQQEAQAPLAQETHDQGFGEDTKAPAAPAQALDLGKTQQSTLEHVRQPTKSLQQQQQDQDQVQLLQQQQSLSEQEISRQPTKGALPARQPEQPIQQQQVQQPLLETKSRRPQLQLQQEPIRQQAEAKNPTAGF